MRPRTAFCRKKVYLDEATGLPNKNKCEEILNNDTFLEDGETVAVCVFDLNNLRIINNNLGHEKGDEYIRSFAVQLRGAMPAEHFVGRDGGDEFLAVIHGLEREAVEAGTEPDSGVFCRSSGDAHQLCGWLCDFIGF